MSVGYHRITSLPDIIRHDAKTAAKEIELMKAVEKLMRELEEKGLGDRFADMQQRSAPKMLRKYR